MLLGVGGLVLPAQYGITSAFLAGLCAFLAVAAVILFVAFQGPDTFAQVLRSAPLAGSVLVVAVLLVLSDPGPSLRWVWIVIAAAAAAWSTFALWQGRRSGG